MPHAASTFATSVKQRTSPADTAAAEAAHVAAVAAAHAREDDTVEAMYRDLTGVADPAVFQEPVPQSGTTGVPTLANTKAEIVEYIKVTFGTEVGEPGLSNMTKQELLDLIEDLTD